MANETDVQVEMTDDVNDDENEVHAELLDDESEDTAGAVVSSTKSIAETTLQQRLKLLYPELTKSERDHLDKLRARELEMDDKGVDLVAKAVSVFDTISSSSTPDAIGWLIYSSCYDGGKRTKSVSAVYKCMTEKYKMQGKRSTVCRYVQTAKNDIAFLDSGKLSEEERVLYQTQDNSKRSVYAMLATMEQQRQLYDFAAEGNVDAETGKFSDECSYRKLLEKAKEIRNASKEIKEFEPPTTIAKVTVEVLDHPEWLFGPEGQALLTQEAIKELFDADNVLKAAFQKACGEKKSKLQKQCDADEKAEQKIKDALKAKQEASESRLEELGNYDTFGGLITGL